MNATAHPQGRFVPTHALHEAPLGRVLAGRDQQTGLPAIAIVFSRAGLNDVDRAWFVARGLKPVPAVRAPALIDAQTSPHPWVAVAWAPSDMGVSGDALPTRIADTLKWFVGLADAGPEVGIGHVLSALDRLEPRGAPGTVVLDSAPRAGTSAAGSARSTDTTREPAGETTAGSTQAEDAGAVAQVDPPAAIIPPTKVLPQAPLADAIAQWKAGAHHASKASQHPVAKGKEADVDLTEAIAPPRPPGRGKAATTRAFIALGAVSAAALAIVSWATLRSHVPRLPTPSPAAPAPSPSPVSPASRPPPVAPVAEAPTPEPPAAPAAAARPARSADAPEAPSGESRVVRTVTLETSPPGADVCDPKTGKSLGRTPLAFPADELHRGRRLVLTVRGHRALEMRWPPRKQYRFEPLGADEAQALSPCAF